MEFQETGRFGRITKNLRKQGFEDKMDTILLDSIGFPELKKEAKVRYVEATVNRMKTEIGTVNTKKVLFECGVKCCGKTWAKWAKTIWDNSDSLNDFFVNLNKEEEKYNTQMSYDKEQNVVYVMRSKCICGLVNKGNISIEPNLYCSCSSGHMDVFFSSVFSVNKVELKQSIFNGAKTCRWKVKLNNWGEE